MCQIIVPQIFNLKWILRDSEKSDSDLANNLEDGIKLKIPYEIKPSLSSGWNMLKLFTVPKISGLAYHLIFDFMASLYKRMHVQ